MKIVADTLLTLSVSFAAYLLVPQLHGWFGSLFLVSSQTTVYWGWFDWLTVLDWVPRLLMGVAVGIILTLFIRSDGAHLWALLAGVLLMVAAFLTSGPLITSQQPMLQTVFQHLWPLMYPLGAFAGSVIVLAIRHYRQGAVSAQVEEQPGTVDPDL